MADQDKPTVEGLMGLVARYGNREWQAGFNDAEGKEPKQQEWASKASATQADIRAYAERLAHGVKGTPAPLTELRRLIADDAYAITFQSFGQYRTALLKAIDKIAAGGVLGTSKTSDGGQHG